MTKKGVKNLMLAVRMFEDFHSRIPDMHELSDVTELFAICEDIEYARENSERRNGGEL